MRTVYLNGQFVPESEATVSIYSLDVMQAAAAFEMTRSFHGVHVKLREHLARLLHSCTLLSIPLPNDMEGDLDYLEELCHSVSGRNDHGPGEEHRLLIVVSPGCAPMYRELDGVIPHPFVYIADFPLRLTVQGFSKYFTEGVHCVTSKVQQVPDACVPSAAKHRARLHFHLAQQQAPTGTWPILRDAQGWYCEAPGANLVTVRYDKRKGPSIGCLDAHALPGISLQTVRELTGGHSDTWARRQHAPQELWLTGTPFFALPVVQLDGKPIGNGKIGPVYKAMMEKADALVGLCIKDQIIKWDEEANTRSGVDAGVREAISRTPSRARVGS